jgi:hypothetical protein
MNCKGALKLGGDGAPDTKFFMCSFRTSHNELAVGRKTSFTEIITATQIASELRVGIKI